MIINTDNMFSLSQANQNFSEIARFVNKNSEAVILKHNKPKYLLIDLESDNRIFDLSDDEKISIISNRVLKTYLPAFKELAK